MLGIDVVVIGAGAAGMICAWAAGAAGQQVMLIDHATKLAEKIRISGGGRCNFTNREVTPENFISGNPHFCRSALAAFSERDFIKLVGEHGITWHEKHRGQLFCDNSSDQIIQMLKSLCDQTRVQWRMPCRVQEIRSIQGGFVLETSEGPIQTKRVVIATGGTALPQIGATDFGLKVARQFGLRVVEPRPALVPLKFDAQFWQPFSQLAGLALEVQIAVSGKTGGQTFLEDMLFTHRGLSGPAILQISSYWQPGESISINLAPNQSLADELILKKSGTKQQLSTVLSELWPKRLAEVWLGEDGRRKLAEWSDKSLRTLSRQIHDWAVQPSGTEGFKKAEVMLGGVDTHELDPRTLESRRVPGLHFIGEVVDVTGWLGGYNFQWAWSSGVACGRALALSS